MKLKEIQYLKMKACFKFKNTLLAIAIIGLTEV